MALKTTKVKVVVSHEVELRFDPEEAYKEFPDSMWPLEDFATELIEQQGLDTVLAGSKDKYIEGVVIND